jgi:thymidylate kinase
VQKLRGETLNDFEQEGTLARVARIFAGLTSPNIRRIDGTGEAGVVHELIMKAVAELL